MVIVWKSGETYVLISAIALVPDGGASEQLKAVVTIQCVRGYSVKVVGGVKILLCGVHVPFVLDIGWPFDSALNVVGSVVASNAPDRAVIGLFIDVLRQLRCERTAGLERLVSIDQLLDCISTYLVEVTEVVNRFPLGERLRVLNTGVASTCEKISSDDLGQVDTNDDPSLLHVGLPAALARAFPTSLIDGLDLAHLCLCRSRNNSGLRGKDSRRQSSRRRRSHGRSGKSEDAQKSGLGELHDDSGWKRGKNEVAMS